MKSTREKRRRRGGWRRGKGRKRPEARRTLGIVIHLNDILESDRIVTLLTRGDGKIRGMAKGARASQKRFEGRFDLFLHLDLTYGIYPGTSLLERAAIIDPFLKIRSDPFRMGVSSYLAELANLLLPEGEPSKEPYLLLLESFSEIERRRDFSSVMRLFELRLLNLSGFRPFLEKCLSCGRAVLDKEGSGFSPMRGGVVCSGCVPSERDARPLSKGALSFMRRALATPYLPASRLSPTKALSDEMKGHILPFIMEVAKREPLTVRYLRWAGLF